MEVSNSILNRHIVINGCRIATGVHGSGTPLVLIHGTPAHSVIWQELVPVFVEAGFCVHLYDMPGFGASERPVKADTSVVSQVNFLLQLLECWHLDRTHFFGHDIGGVVSLRLAFEHPSRLHTLTLADIPSYDSWPSPTWKDMRDNYAECALMSPDEHCNVMSRQLRMAVFNKNVMAGKRMESYLAPLCGVVGQSSFYQHQVAHYNACYTSDFAEKLPLLRLPIQILWGKEDEWQPVEYSQRLQRDIASSTLHFYEEAGHFLMEDVPLSVAAQVISFINKHHLR
ncbi:MAG: alpha/beta fold hydrolase [Pantoea agglomerans]